MNRIKIQKTLYIANGERAVIGRDAAHRCFLGISNGGTEVGAFLFVQIDRVTLLELERGTADARTALRDRCAGIVVRPAQRWLNSAILSTLVGTLGA